MPPSNQSRMKAFFLLPLRSGAEWSNPGRKERAPMEVPINWRRLGEFMAVASGWIRILG